MTTPTEMAKKEPRLVPIPKAYRELDEAEMRAAFGACSEDNALWLAINQILRGYIIMVGEAMSDVETAANHGELAHWAGGYEWLGSFQARINAHFKAEHEVDAGLMRT